MQFGFSSGIPHPSAELAGIIQTGRGAFLLTGSETPAKRNAGNTKAARLMTKLPVITGLALQRRSIRSCVWKCQLVWFWLKLRGLLSQGQVCVKTP